MHTPDWPREPSCVINGHPLNQGQALTLRVAVGQFMLTLSDPEFSEGMGELADGYMARLREIAAYMHESEPVRS